MEGQSDDDAGQSPGKNKLKDYQASVKGVEGLNAEIDELRHQLSGFLDDRDDAAITLSAYNTRALSAIRGIFGPDSTDYDQAGGTRTSERTKSVRKAAVVK